MQTKYNFLNFILAVALGLIAGCSHSLLANSEKDFPIKIAGYDYDRVRAIMDGQVGIKDAEVNFHIENIYALNSSAFGPEKKYEVTEIKMLKIPEAMLILRASGNLYCIIKQNNHNLLYIDIDYYPPNFLLKISKQPVSTLIIYYTIVIVTY